MMKSLFGKVSPILAVLLVAVCAALACLPVGAIRYDPIQATAIHGSAEAFSKTQPVLLYSVDDAFWHVVPNGLAWEFSPRANYWLESATTQISTLRGYAHFGGTNQQDANQKIALIQIWGWLDTNGNGQADAGDTTTAWVKLVELHPSANGGDGSGGNTVGFKAETQSWWGSGVVPTSTWRADLLQGHTIPLNAGQSWLLLLRVVDVNGNTNLMSEHYDYSPPDDGWGGHWVGDPEWWDSGGDPDVGSGDPNGRFLDYNGSSLSYLGSVPRQAIVWVYVPKLK